MRIAILANSLPPHSLGGSEIQAASTARRLAARGHAVTLFGRAVAGDRPGATREEGVLRILSPTPGIPGLRAIGHMASFLRDWRRFDGRRCEVILAYQMFLPGFLGTLVRSSSRPLVSWVRSEAEILVTRSRKYRFFSPRVLAASRIVLLQSGVLAEIMNRELTAVRGTPFATSVAERRDILPNAVAVGPPPNYTDREGLVYLGRLVRCKGADLLIEALRRLASPPPLRVFGDGDQRDSLERAARGLPITFEGAIPAAEIPARLGGARVLVSPSRSEGFPNAILEGMERGIPPVATAVGAVPDVVRDGTNGRVVAADDPAALASAIDSLYRGKDWEPTARAARATAETYGWTSHIERLESILIRARDGRSESVSGRPWTAPGTPPP